MAEKSNENVEVGFSETEIIGSTETDSSAERKFRMTNGDKEIIATVHGSDDNVDWRLRESKNISPKSSDIIELEVNHDKYIKLIAKTTIFGESSLVNTTFIYTESYQE